MTPPPARTPVKKPPARLSAHATRPGRPWPMGATFDGEGVNFAVFSAHAEKLELCLFSEDGRKERARLPFVEREGDIWHMHVGGLTPGVKYGLRAHGPYRPEEGHRFNPNKLLIDPYAKQLAGRLRWSDAVMGYRVGSPRADLSFDSRDSAFAMPKSVVVDPSFPWAHDAPLAHPIDRTVIYEAHVKGLTERHPKVDPGLRGTYLGVASEPMIEHLVKLGVTAIELLPIHAHIDDRFLVSQGLRNYWGYQTIGFFAPEPRYMSQNAVWEMQTMVRRLHAAGIEVILDVVYNHSGEGDHLGPTLSFRGLDNRSYYRLVDGGRYYVNDTGTGNALDLTNPMVLRMAMDSLRYWVETFHVDGFRFDLAAALARHGGSYNRRAPFLDAIRQDPMLSRVKLIVEPWDVGPGGYQLGNFPHPFLEWNDRFRDTARRFWRGDPGVTAELAGRLLGSAAEFDSHHRAATSSVNQLTAHDGFTLEDVVSYRHKHNEANGEDNRDGHSENFSDNMGVEGPATDPKIRAARDARKRAMLATLFLAQGTPMLLGGDEFGNSQGGNNNAYAQDNETGWLNWSARDETLIDFTGRLIALRRAHPALRQRAFLHGRPRADGTRDIVWRLPGGAEPSDADWHDADFRCLCAELRMAAGGLPHATPGGPAGAMLYCIFNGGPAVDVTLPQLGLGRHWRLLLDSARPAQEACRQERPQIAAAQGAVLVLAETGD